MALLLKSNGKPTSGKSGTERATRGTQWVRSSVVEQRVRLAGWRILMPCVCFVIYPRIHRFIPSRTILEIALRFGRWAQFLKTQCQSMIAVDSEACTKHSKTRFASESHIRLHTDGTSLAAIPDNSIDLEFSFDSLVHVEKDVMEAYLSQLARKLTKDGIGFVHHSNLRAYRGRLGLINFFNKLPSGLRQELFSTEKISSLLPLEGWRASSMTAQLFR